VHILVPLLLSALSCAGTLYKVYAFKPNDYDYGIFSNLLWNFANGNGWLMSLYAGDVRENFLADHLALIVPLFSPLFTVFPSPYALAVLHSLAFGATFFLVPIFVQKIWNDNGRKDYSGAALFLLLALFLSRGFAAAWSFPSHMTTLVMPFLLGALIALHSKRLFVVALCCVIVVLAQERAILAITGFGMYAFLVTKNRFLGFVLCLMSSIYFILAVKIIIPSFNTTSVKYYYDSYIDPLYSIQKKLYFIWKIFLTWFLFPLAGRRALFSALCALPVLSLGLVSNRETMFGISHQYIDLPSIFLLAASTHGLFWLMNKSWHARTHKFAVIALALVLLFFSGRESRRFLPMHVFATIGDNQEISLINQDIAPYMNITPEVSVYATSGIGPRLSLRKKRYQISPARAQEDFEKSIVIIAPTLSKYPYASAEPLIQALHANSSLYLLEDTGRIVVYASHDLKHSQIFKHP
jgi:uncharacterized membrane protein